MRAELFEIKRQALSLPVKDRAALAEHLFASLDDLAEQELESMWIGEAERRYQAYIGRKVKETHLADIHPDFLSYSI